MASGIGRLGPALALLAALAAASAVSGCGRYGPPVRNAPREASAAEARAPEGLEAERPADEDEERRRERERSEEE